MKINWQKLKPGKKTVVVALVAILACVAVYLNWDYQRKNAEVNAGDGNELLSDYEAVDNRRILDEDYTSVGIDGLSEGNASQETSVDYFAATRLARQQARDEAVSILESTEASISASDEAKTNASAAIAKLASNTIIEARIESLVKAKGYTDCVAFINENGINVVVGSNDNMNDEDAAKIKDIVISETGISATMIKIVEAGVDD